MLHGMVTHRLRAVCILLLSGVSFLFVGGALVTAPVAMTAGAAAAVAGAVIHTDAALPASADRRSNDPTEQEQVPPWVSFALFVGGLVVFVLGAGVVVSDLRRRPSGTLSLPDTIGQSSALVARGGLLEER